MKTRIVSLIAAGMLLISQTAFAGEADILINKLAEKGVITYGEAQQLLTEGKEDARAKLAQAKIETLPYWIQNLSIKGDLRLRHQIDWAENVNYARVRERMRLRLGFETRTSKNLKAGFGLATGSEKISGTTVMDSEATSTNHTFAGFGKAMLMVDYAYLQYNPFSTFKLTAGKMKAGTQIWNATDLLWDTDINPDGVAISYSYNVLSELTAGVNASWLILNEIKTAGKSNPDVTIAQPYLAFAPTEKVSIKAAFNVQNFNVNGKDTVICGIPTFDYMTTGLSAEAKFLELVGPYSLALVADMVSNGDSKPTADKSASAYGFKFGHDKLSELGQWQLICLGRKKETNAFPAIGDSDAYGGAANSTGYEVIANMGLTKELSLGVDYYAMELINTAAGASKVPKSLLQIDLAYKF